MKRLARGLILFAALIPPGLIILWGEFSEFNINFWFLPTVDVLPSFAVLEQVLIVGYFLATPFLLLVYTRDVPIFKRDNTRFVIVVISCVASFALLRYLEFLYDTNALSATAAFGNYYPLAFWSLPLLITVLAAFLLSSGE